MNIFRKIEIFFPTKLPTQAPETETPNHDVLYDDYDLTSTTDEFLQSHDGTYSTEAICRKNQIE